MSPDRLGGERGSRERRGTGAGRSEQPARTTGAVLGLQQMVGNRRVCQALAAGAVVQRDGPGFVPAPAGPYAPPPPPVPGSPEDQAQLARRDVEAARRMGEDVGAAWGKFEAEVADYLSIVNQARPTPAERRKEVQKILAESEKLPSPEEPDDPAQAEAYRNGVGTGYGTSYAAATAFMVAVTIGFELVKSRNLRLPSMKWGRWAGTPGNSKFLFNEEGIARFKLDKVGWIRFAGGKADFSAVAYQVEGRASVAVQGITGNRDNDYKQTVRTLATIWNKKPKEVEQFLSSNNLRVHHYKKDLMQLVPENYHRVGHQGTVADLKAIAAAAAGVTAGLYALLETFQEGK